MTSRMGEREDVNGEAVGTCMVHSESKLHRETENKIGLDFIP